MTVINSALALRIDGGDAVRAYMDGAIVWPSSTGNMLSASIAKVSGQAKVTVTASSSGIVPDQFKYYLSTNGGAWTFKADTAETSVTISTSYSTKVKAKVESYKNGILLQTAFTSEITTDAAPPPPTQQKVATLSRVEWNTWTGGGTQKGYNSGPLYSGYFDSNNGNQRSSVRFNLPTDLPNCKSIDKVEFSAWNDHAYNGDGGDSHGRTVWLAVHHYSDLDSANGIRYGSTKPFGSFRAEYRDSWVGGAEWVNITNLVCPDRYSVKEEFRRWGAKGLHFHQSPTNSQSNYGYVRNDVRIRFTYTVYT